MVLESNTLDVLFVKDGQQGEDGKILYTWIKYAKDASGTGITDDPNGAIYIGISYNNESSIESNDPTHYAWTKIQGADGKKGEDAYTIFLENENISFATDKNRNPLSEQAYTSGITIMKGAKPVTDFTIGDIAKTQGIAIAKGNDGISISVVNGNALPADSGEITVPISVGGTVFKKVLTWTCAKKGEQGDKGDRGEQGIPGNNGADGDNFSWNLIKNGKGDVKRGFFKNFDSVNSSEEYAEITLTSKKNYVGPQLVDGYVIQPRDYKVGEQVTFSFDIMYTKWDFPTGSKITEFNIGQRYRNAPSGETATGQWVGITHCGMPQVGKGCELNKWFHFKSTFTIPAQASSNVSTGAAITFYNNSDVSATMTFRMKNVKLEYGDTATPWSPAQSDLEGRGVSETVQYYLATSQASGVTSSTSGWSTDITTQKLTGDKKYLWNCYQTKYSDGTSESISTPKVIGVYGDKGETGVSTKILTTSYSYNQSDIDKYSKPGYSGTWGVGISTNGLKVGDNVLLRAKNTSKNSDCLIFAQITKIVSEYQVTCTSYGVIDNGTDAKNLSITPSSQYFKSTDGGKTFAPNTITIKPTIQGEINFGKWQYSIDGGVSFADVVSGQKGLTISNNVLTVSKDSSLYSDAVTMVTFRAVASDSSFYDTCSIAKIYDVSDIGDGRNLLWNSNFAKTDEAINTSTYTTWGLILRGNTYTATIDTSVKHNNFNTLKVIGTKAGENGGQDLIYRIKGLNLDEIKFTETGVKYTLSFYAKASIACNFSARYAYDSYAKDTNVALSTDWKRYEIQMHPTTTSYQTSLIFKMDAASTVWFSEFKLEKGSSATGYSTAPEDLQTAILSTKNSIENVSSKVDTNTKSIQDKVSKTTYETDLKLVKGDLSKANDGLNKWRYEIYPKSLFESEDQGKSTIDIFARNLNLVPTQTVLLDDASLSTGMNYGDNHIAYALTFVKMSTKKDVTTKMFNDDGASLYVNGKLIGSYGIENTSGHDVTFTLARGWNCIEVVVNEEGGLEGFRFSTTLSKLSECQMMNCYYGTPVARQSRITNQLVDVTKNLTGVTSTVQDVMTAVGNSGNITEFKNNYSKWKQSVDKIETRVGEKYVTNEKFNGLEIGGRNLLLNSAFKNDRKNWTDWGTPATRELVTSNNKIWAHIVGNKQNYQGLNQWTESGSIKTGDNITFSARIKGGAANQIFTIGIHWMSSSNTIIDQTWHTFTVGTTDDVYTWTTTASGANCSKLNLMVGVSDTSTAYNVYFTELKLEKGNKATDWTPAPEDDEINGQNLVSNLPSNWEQGSFMDSKTNVGCDYATNKSSMTTRIRVKELVPVSGTITISNAYSNQSKKPIQHWITAFDVNKKWLGASYVSTAWSDFPRIIDVKDAKYIAVIVGYTDNSAITPSDISQICLKIERGTSATPFTLAPEDVNGKIQSIETIATQTADKFSWLVKSGTSSSNFELTDKTATLVASKINQYGLVTFNGLSTDAKNGILNSFEVGGRNLALNTSNSYSTAFTSFSGVENTCFDLGQVTCKGIAIGDVVTVHLYIKYTDIVPASGQTARIWLQGYGNITVWNNGAFAPSEYKAISGSGEFEFLYSFTMSSNMYINTYWTCGLRTDYIASGSIQYKAFKVEKGNKPTDWTPAPEDYLPQANLVSNWTTNTTWIDGGKIYTGSITADKIDVVNLFAQDITASGTIQSKNYTESGGNVTDGSKWVLKDGSFKSKNLSWDLNGNLIAKNANLSGQITATKGTVGGWNIDNYSIYTTYDANQNIFGAGISGTKGKYVLWAGETNDAIGANRSSNVPTDASLVIYNNGGLEVRKSMVGNDKKNHLYTTILQSGQINLKMDDDYIGTITATDTISSNSTVTMRHVSMAAKNGYGWSILHTNESGSLISDMQRDPGDTKIKINSPITVFSTDITKYNAIETTGDVVVSGKIHANYGSNKIQLNPDNNGSIELYGYTPFIDFHYGNSDSDYTSRIIAQEWGLQIVGTATVTGDLYCDAHIYTCTNGHFSWAGQTDAYLGCGNYSGGNNIYYYANYHAFYVNNDSGSGMMYINTNGVTSRVGFTKTSDERIKKNFESFDDNIIDAYMNIEPVKYQLKQSSNDSYHFGFKAQHIDKVFSDYGDAYNESFDICTSRPIDPDKAKELYGVDDMTEEYGLRYDELIAPTAYMVQHIYKELESTKGELAKVKQEKADLETRLQAIEAKLGL